jgi:hypothetical protein
MGCGSTFSTFSSFGDSVTSACGCGGGCSTCSAGFFLDFALLHRRCIRLLHGRADSDVLILKLGRRGFDRRERHGDGGNDVGLDRLADIPQRN